jgi:hypothetical protein
MKLHRLPKLLGEMGDFWRPRLLVPSQRAGRAKPPAKKPKDRDRLKLIDHPGGLNSPYQDVCFSATCYGCGKVWISAIRAIPNNAERDGKSVYLCGNCR